MAKDFEKKKRKGMYSSISSQLLVFWSPNWANFIGSMPERDAEKATKVKNVVANTSRAPAMKRKGIYRTIVLQ